MCIFIGWEIFSQTPVICHLNAQNYIQYHNADSLGTYPTADLDFKSNVDLLSLDNSVRFGSWIYTKKKLVEKAVGQSCFLIVGKTEQKIKKYFLWAYFKLEDYEISKDGYYNVYGTGYDLAKPILLNELENFNDFKDFCGNFGLGFQNIDKHNFCRTLISLLPEQNLNSLNLIEKSSEDAEKFTRPTTEQYQDTIANKLSPRQIEILQVLYHFPNSSATAIQLAEALNYKSFHGANRQIGALGEAFYKHSGVQPPTYIGGEGFAYFYFIGEYKKKIGWIMWAELKTALENLNLVIGDISQNVYTDRLPTEIMPFEEKKFYEEGKATEIFVNRYERNQKARLECIKHYGNICQGCSFDFETFYGGTVKVSIQVHHIVSLAEIGKTYKVNPITDLIPLCPNCHAVVHSTKPALTIEALRKLTKKNGI